MPRAKKISYGLTGDEVRKVARMYTECRDRLNRLKLDFNPRKLMKETIQTVLQERKLNDPQLAVPLKGKRKARLKVNASHLAMEE
jgi:hypothetical protein